MNNVVTELGSRSLQALIDERIATAAKLSKIDDDIRMQLHHAQSGVYRAVTADSMADIIDKNKAGLKVSELTDISGLSLDTYYAIRNNIDKVAVGKLSKLLDVLGLQLYVGKRS